MQDRKRLLPVVVASLVLVAGLPLAVLAGRGEQEAGGSGPARSEEPAATTEPEPAPDRARPDALTTRPEAPVHRGEGDRVEPLCFDRQGNPRLCPDDLRRRCAQADVELRRCLGEMPIDRCAELADNHRRCVEPPPASPNYRTLFWRLVHAREWKLVIRLLHALGLV